MKRKRLSRVETAWAKAHAANAPHMMRVCQQMLKDPRCADALDAITNDPNKKRAVVFSCVGAELLARTFNKRVPEEKRTGERMHRLKASVDEIRRFLDTADQMPDHIASMVDIPGNKKRAAQSALNLIDGVINARLELVNRNLVCWGVTRKSAPTNKKAAEIAAIGWIAATVNHVAGKPMSHHVAVLAEATLGLRDVSIDRVRRALKTTAPATKWAESEMERRIRDKNMARTRH